MALRLVAAVVARLTPRARAALGLVLAWAAGSLLRVRRRLVEGAMARAGIDDPSAAAREMYESLGRGLVDLLWLAGSSDRDRAVAAVSIDRDALDALDVAVSRGPVVLLASHTGNWELAAAAAARHLRARGRALAVVAKPIRARSFDGFMCDLRAALGITVLSPEGAFAAAQRALAAGDVLVMPIDQVPDRPRHGRRLSFLGQTALVDRAPATIAWRARATALVVAAEREGGRERVRLLEVVLPPGPDDASGRWIDGVTRVATARLEAFVRAKPASWLWLHRRWSAPRPIRPPTARLVATRKAG